jgi:hypothetical protein
MKRTLCALALVLVTVPGSRAAAQILYAATGSNGIPGTLYTVNPATGAATVVGPTLIGSSPIGLTGLAFHPTTRVLYGATVNSGPSTNLHSLVTIDPATGAATLIGSMLDPVGDIAFDAGGTLYGWQAGGTPKSLVKIDLATGLQTQIGISLLTNTSGNGLSFVTGTLFLAANGSGGALRSVDPASGSTTVGPTLSGAPQAGAIAALAVNSSGILFGVNTNQGVSPTTCNLVIIDTNTGAVHDRGALPADTDAIAFTNAVLGTSPGSFFPVTPCRVLDTRTTSPIAAGGTRALAVTGGACGIAAVAKAVSLNVTVTGNAATGHLILYAANLAVPSTSAISFDTGRTRANNAIVQIATDGSGAINIVNASLAQVDVVVDVNGFFQ